MKNRIFSAILKSQRKAAGYNQADAAKRLYLSRSTYNHYETGKRTPPVDILIRISALYRLHPADLICSLLPHDIRVDYPEYIDTLYSGKYSFSTGDVRLCSYYHCLCKEEQDMVIQLIYLLNKRHRL